MGTDGGLHSLFASRSGSGHTQWPHFTSISSPLSSVLFSGDVDQVDLPGAEGDMGILAGHAPLVTALRPGILTIFRGGAREPIVIVGGFAEVGPGGLTVLADHAVALERLRCMTLAADIKDAEEDMADATRSGAARQACAPSRSAARRCRRRSPPGAIDGAFDLRCALAPPQLRRTSQTRRPPARRPARLNGTTSSGRFCSSSQRHSTNSGSCPPAGMRDVDLAVVAGETQRVPFLLLAAVFAVPGLPDDLARNVVGQPFRDLAEALDRA